jgi:predicted P-loop ATPase
MLACEYFGADDTPLHRRISEAWAISCVARIMRPGCQAKYMLVLESPQDESKSKALRALTNGHLHGDEGIQWFRDSLPDIDKSDIGLYMQGVWIIEVAELSAIRGKAWERTKAFISSQVDTFRVPYGRNMQDYPRQCVFAATTNEQQWGGDQTGLARFWPIRTGHIDVPGILRDRDQLWAEARTLYDEGRPWWLDTETEKLAREAQQERMPEDSVAEHVAASVDSLLANSLGDDVSVSEILTHLKWSEKDGPAVGRALTRLGYESYRPRDGATRIRRYRKKG